MTQDERREYLIHYLLKEEMKFVRQSIPTDKQGQENPVSYTHLTLPTKRIV